MITSIKNGMLLSFCIISLATNSMEKYLQKTEMQSLWDKIWNGDRQKTDSHRIQDGYVIVQNKTYRVGGPMSDYCLTSQKITWKVDAYKHLISWIEGAGGVSFCEHGDTLSDEDVMNTMRQAGAKDIRTISAPIDITKVDVFGNKEAQLEGSLHCMEGYRRTYGTRSIALGTAAALALTGALLIPALAGNTKSPLSHLKKFIGSLLKK
jgi:hypothetical protein